MSNERRQGGVQLRDWTAIARRRTGHLQPHLSSGVRLASIARVASQPTLRLFGAGRRNGPVTATALPRSLPFILRLRRPRRATGPVLTVQSETPIQLSQPELEPPERETSVTAAPAGIDSTPAPAEAAPRPQPAPRPSLVNRVVRRLFRREAPQSEPAAEASPPPQPAGAGPSEPARPSEARISRSVAHPSPAPAPAPQPQLQVRRQAAQPSAPVEAAALPEAIEPTIALSSQPAAAEPPVTPQEPVRREAAAPSELPRPEPRPASGVLTLLRRVFRAPQPVTPDVAPSASALADPPAEPRRVTPAPSSGEVAQPVLHRSVSPSEPEPEAAPAAPRTRESASPQPARAPESRPSGLVYTLRRLVRREAAPAAAPTLSKAPSPEPPVVARAAARPAGTSEAGPVTGPRSADLAEDVEETPRGVQEPAPLELTLSRQFLRRQEPEAETWEASSAAPAATPEVSPAPSRPASYTQPAARVEAAPGPQLSLRRSRAPSSPEPVMQTYEAAPRRGATALVARSQAEPAPLAGDRLAEPSQTGEAAPTLLRRPQVARTPQAAARPETPLVYRSKQAAALTAPLAVGRDGIVTIEAPRDEAAGPVGAGVPVLSRAAAPEAGGANAEAGGKKEEAAAAEGGGKEVNLETLARQIYARLRWHLLVERERAGLGGSLISR